jgi:hypothetical protein
MKGVDTLSRENQDFLQLQKWPVGEKCKLANKKMAQFLNWDNSEIEQFSN